METENTEEPTTFETTEYSEAGESAPQPIENEQTYILLCHIAAPIIWPWKRKLSLLVDIHGRAALNHMISCTGLMIATSIVLWLVQKTGLISGNTAMIIQLPVLLGSIGYSIFGLIKADVGVLIKYPFPFQWVEKWFSLPEIKIEADPATEMDD